MTGNKPLSKEKTIFNVPDAIEPVDSSNRNRSHERNHALVNGMIAERLADGQFDESDLTMRDLKTIGETFKATLRSIYHPRIEYPAPTKAELQSAAAQPHVGYLRAPSDPMEAPPQTPHT